jgi:signal transduction histidine kinase
MFHRPYAGTSIESEPIKTRAIALTHHELRTPVAIIHSSLELLCDDLHDSLPPGQQELLSRALASSGDLVRGVESVTEMFVEVWDTVHAADHTQRAAMQLVERSLYERGAARVAALALNFEVRGLRRSGALS